MIHQRHRQTVRQTDNMRSQDRALHYSTSRGKNGACLCHSEICFNHLADNQRNVKLIYADLAMRNLQ